MHSIPAMDFVISQSLVYCYTPIFCLPIIVLTISLLCMFSHVQTCRYNSNTIFESGFLLAVGVRSHVELWPVVGVSSHVEL